MHTVEHTYNEVLGTGNFASLNIRVIFLHPSISQICALQKHIIKSWGITNALR